MPNVKSNAILPKGDENGLYAIAADLISDRKRFRAVIAIVDCRRVNIDSDTGEETATIRMRRVEVVLPGDLAAAEKLMRRSLEKRTGATTLPLELEEEIEQAFRDLPDEEPGEELPFEPGPDSPQPGETPETNEPGDDEPEMPPDPFSDDEPGDDEPGERM